jgi:hypothetical protein
VRPVARLLGRRNLLTQIELSDVVRYCGSPDGCTKRWSAMWGDAGGLRTVNFLEHRSPVMPMLWALLHDQLNIRMGFPVDHFGRRPGARCSSVGRPSRAPRRPAHAADQRSALGLHDMRPELNIHAGANHRPMARATFGGFKTGQMIAIHTSPIDSIP